MGNADSGTILVSGNAALDHILLPDSFSYEANRLRFSVNGTAKEVEVGEPSVIVGGKHRLKGSTIDDVLDGLSPQVIPGGDGLISAVALRRMGYDVAYADASRFTGEFSQIAEMLQGIGIKVLAYGFRDPPRNIVLELCLAGIDDTVVLRQGKLERVGRLQPEYASRIGDIASSSSVVLGSSLKDPDLARIMRDAAISANVPLVMGLTTSLERGFMLDEMVPFGILTLNRAHLEMFGERLNYQHNGGSGERRTVNLIQAMRRRMPSGYPLFVMDGVGKAFVSTGATIYDTHVLASNGNGTHRTNGISNVFAAAVAAEYTKKDVNPIEAAKAASLAVIKNVGYELPPPEPLKGPFKERLLYPTSR